MKGKELIDLIERNGLEDFDLEFSFTDGYNVFPNVRTFAVERIDDVGYSDKVAILSGEER